MISENPGLGAALLDNGGCRFHVWAPFTDTLDVHIVSPQERLKPLTRNRYGYYDGTLPETAPGACYFFRLNGIHERPDPASRFQPFGVHGPSQIIDPAFAWTDGNWRGLPLGSYILYELHAGTFTPEGTFEAAITRLDDLADLGITAVEIMPVSQFPGERNWGYDGVYPFAAQNSYGGPSGLKRFVDACHKRGLAVILDAVYNHLGPEGNYLADFGPYFSDSYRTPWGRPLNFDGPCSDDVRRYFIENALYWILDCHIDALRLDAVHAIFDFSARPFLQELAETVRFHADRTGRRIHLIAESALNDTRIIRPPALGGLGLDAQWNDDLHHALHAVLTRERHGYYVDYGRFDHLLKALRDGFVYDGQFSEYRKRRHGHSSRSIPGRQFVVFSQNHDQVGNRMNGERLSLLVSFEALKMAAGLILLSANLPLVFMGEEYGETAPFPYFISHGDAALVDAVRKGRAGEFASFGWHADPPDPQAEETFLSAKLRPEISRKPGPHRYLLKFYQHLIHLRKKCDALFPQDAIQEVFRIGTGGIGGIRRRCETAEICIFFHIDAVSVSADVPLSSGRWQKWADSSDRQWGGPGSAIAGTIDTDGGSVIDFSPYAFIMLARSPSER